MSLTLVDFTVRIWTQKVCTKDIGSFPEVKPNLTVKHLNCPHTGEWFNIDDNSNMHVKQCVRNRAKNSLNLLIASSFCCPNRHHANFG